MPMRALGFISLFAILTVGGSCAGAPRAAGPAGTGSVAADLRNAVSTAVDALPGQAETPEDFVAVGAQQVVLDGKYVCIVTFKLARLLPPDPSSEIVGLGGELFAAVDPETRRAVFRGGE